MNRKHTGHAVVRNGRLAAVVAMVLAVLPIAGAAHADDWRFSVTPYAWATDIGVDASLNGRQVVDKTIPVSDLVDDITFMFQVRLEAQHGDFGAMVDLFDVSLSNDVKGVPLPEGAGSADLSSDIGMTILDVAGVYDHTRTGRGFAVFAGTRLLDQRATIDATMNLTNGPSVAQHYETDDWLTDALVGARFTMHFSPHWGVRMQGDASTGDTDYTWSAGPTLSYAFGNQGRFGVSAGYRYMKVDYKDNGSLDARMTLSGADVGFRVSF